ncbi:MAG TPA: non-canonical purine NTP pyrophosphatase [Chloroflexota bacterium]
MRSIVLASSNPAKRAQLRWLLEGLSVDPIEPALGEVSEDGSSLADNAAAKALAYSVDGLAIASDGGLEIPALPQWDPLRTARQGPAGLRRVAADLLDRRVQWAEAVAIAERGRLLAGWTESGTEGLLAPEPWPEPRDFWVWDIFFFPSAGKVWSALTPAERARLDRTWHSLKADVHAFFREA